MVNCALALGVNPIVILPNHRVIRVRNGFGGKQAEEDAIPRSRDADPSCRFSLSNLRLGLVALLPSSVI